MAKTTTIAGNTFLFTGKLTEFTREDAEAHVEAEGGKVLSGVSAKLNYLVVGEDAGSKLAKAEALGSVTILHEKEFLKMMNSGKKATSKATTKKATTKDSGKPVASNKVSSDKAYEQVQIGKQIWMAKNLDVTHFRNGDPIPEVKSIQDWIKAKKSKKPAFCYYSAGTSFDEPKNYKMFGKLYNWYAVSDNRGLAPQGWHVPSTKEFEVLVKHLGGEDKGGRKMKSKAGWRDGGKDGGNGTNESGFNGLPGGFRNEKGSYDSVRHYAIYWLADSRDDEFADYFQLEFTGSSVGGLMGYHKESGLSIRCIKD